MMYKLTKFSLAVTDMEKELNVYTNGMGMQLTARIQDDSQYDVAYIGQGSDGLIELVKKPYIEAEKKYLNRRYSVYSISFETEDVDKAFEEMKGKGVNIAWEPVEVLGMKVFGMTDLDDNLIKVYSYTGNEKIIPTPDLTKILTKTDMTLHHVSLITKDIKTTANFYENIFNLKTISQRTDDIEKTGGFVFMADPYLDSNAHTILFEIMGGPNPIKAVPDRIIKRYEREELFEQEYGYALDHICTVCDDVKGAYEKSIRAGGQEYIEPEEALGACIAWIKDVNGNDVEVMDPVGEDFYNEVLSSKTPIVHCPWE